MLNRIIYKYIVVVVMAVSFGACTAPTLIDRTPDTNVPASYAVSQDTTNIATIKWKGYFKDPHLIALIDTALLNNQELNILLQEIAVSRNEVRSRKGEYLPFVGLKSGTGVDKVGRFTRKGALEANTDIEKGKEFPEPLSDFVFGAYASWEVDIWHKLRNAKKAALSRYLSSVEGKNFMVTNLIAEIANSYFELLALDSQLEILNKNIAIQENAFEIVKLQKMAARVTELAVRKFEAEVLGTRSLQFDIAQKIVETENRINFLVGRFPVRVDRASLDFDELMPQSVSEGLPSQLLLNRTDIKKAELDLIAARLDVKVARARFYPSLGLSAGLGFQAFSLSKLIKAPESMLYSMAGELTAPLINKNAIKAAFSTANARQIQAIYNFEQAILNAYIEVANQLSMIDNLEKSYALRARQVEALTMSIDISNKLFNSARADYMEVLLTQRDALESRFELIETKKEQMNAVVNIYQALGGGWN